MLRVNFSAYNNYQTDTLYQWDTNRKLTVIGLNLTDAPEVHFTNANMEGAIVRQSIISNLIVTCDIPNSLLQDDVPLIAYVGVYEGNTFKTIETIEIPIIPRAKPIDYRLENSDNEVYSFNALENKIDNLILGSDGVKRKLVFEANGTVKWMKA